MELPSALIGDTIRRGQIFHSSIFQDINHGKFFVVIGVTETEVAGFFYINSKVNTNVQKKPDQLAMQYLIKAADYPFLKYDSYINATNVITRSKDELTKSIEEGRTCLVSSMNDDHLDDLLDKVRGSKLFSPIDKKSYFY